MVKGFISKIGNVMEFQELLSLFEQNGVDADNIIINQPLIELTSNLSSGDKLVLISYCDVFLGLSDMFDRCIALADSGMEVRSIKEPEIVFNGEQLSMMRKLHTLGREMRSRRTLNGVNKAKAQGKRLGRPEGTIKFNSKAIAVDKLRRESGLTVVEACKIVGCNTQTYYRFLRAIK